MELETLYKRTKTGDIQYWKVSTFDCQITKESGKLGTTNPIIHKEECIGKNIGKANETTGYEQAESQAQSDWKKKRDEGYKSLQDLGMSERNPFVGGENLEKVLQLHLPKFNTDAAGNVKPMLATGVEKIKAINYPVLVQPKLDGVRCLMIVKDYGVTFLSRSGKEYTTLQHIADSVLGAVFPGDTWNEGDSAEFILDGEIYSDELTFQEITQAVKKQYPNSLKLHFRAYDVVNDAPQNQRISHATALVNALGSPYIHMVETIEDVYSYTVVRELHDTFVQNGYEGAMIRLPNGKYEQGCRSRALIKVKEFDETEFGVVRFELGQREEDLIAVCEFVNQDKGQFKAKMIGNRTYKERVKNDFGMGGLFGVRLTVKHFGWTTDGLPRFPIGKAIRDYE